MKKSYMFAISIVTFVWLPSLATIINIPDDYPTIQQGIDASSDGDTVLVQPGTYVENVNFNRHNITLGSLFLMTGDTTYIAQTIIDANSEMIAVCFVSGEASETELIGLTIKNGYGFWLAGGIYCDNSSPCIRNNVIKDNISAEYGAGILCDNNSNPLISYNRIFGNVARFDGGGIECKDNSNPLIINNIIIENRAAWRHGGGICCQDSDPIMINNVVSGNGAGISGGGIYCGLVSNPTVINAILWADSAAYGDEIDIDDSSSPSFRYCDIEDGWGGEGNIDMDPLFRDPRNGDFHLMSTACGDPYDSPCIDAGHPDILDSLLDCDWGVGTILSDMGAYGGGDSVVVGIDDLVENLPSRFALLQNYPNPFNPSTTLRYSLPQQADVRIEIYDILGQKVATLFDGNQQAGYYSLVWQADDYPSGIYFAKLQTPSRRQSIKMLLLK